MQKKSLALALLSLSLGSGAFAFAVFGAIGDKYAKLGGEHGPLGPPTSDEANAPFGGRINNCTAGSIYWHPKIGQAFGVWGLIGQEHRRLGGAAFGYPITDETPTIDGVGRFNHFRAMQFPDPKPEASIFWTPTTGAHEVHGAIRDAWVKQGFERGDLGYPTSDELSFGPVKVSRFQFGLIKFDAQGSHIESPSTLIAQALPQIAGDVQQGLTADLGSGDLFAQGFTLHDFHLRLGNSDFRFITQGTRVPRADFEIHVNGSLLTFRTTTPGPLPSGTDPEIEARFDMIIPGTIVAPPGAKPHVEGIHVRVPRLSLEGGNITGGVATTLLHILTSDETLRRRAEPIIDNRLRGQITDRLNQLLQQTS
jgi:hypothetical protein